MVTYGIEEEVFVVEPVRPSLKSLYYLSQLLWRRPGFNYFHTAPNLAHLPDIKTGIMAGIEIATGIAPDIHSLRQELIQRRQELAEVCQGLILPLGHLLDHKSPSRTCALHIHIGNSPHRSRAYLNLAHFLPLLSLLTINSPCAGGRYFGQSYRIFQSPFIGPLREDCRYRFQDIIISRRLRTIEIRIFDSTWDLERIGVLLEAIDRIVNLEEELKFDANLYRRRRGRIATIGYDDYTKNLHYQLNEFYPLSEELFQETASDRVHYCYQKNGLLMTYTALDNAYRTGVFEPREAPDCSRRLLPILAGVAGYYLPRLPYILWKTWREIG